MVLTPQFYEDEIGNLCEVLSQHSTWSKGSTRTHAHTHMHKCSY